MKEKPHPLFEAREKVRKAYLELGFKEVINPVFIEEDDIYKQWGAEAPTILDRIYYLAGLPRPDIGLSKEKQTAIKQLNIPLDKEKAEAFQSVLRTYKKGEIESDELIDKVAETLGITSEKASRVLELFPEFKALKPLPTPLTLRSHMTSGWFKTLTEIQKREPLPIQLFSIDRCFRKEQKEDTTHLRTHHSASCVVMGEEVTVETGKKVARDLLDHFGVRRVKFEPKKRSASYYQPNTETEVFAYARNVWMEVADFGIYGVNARQNYGIKYPVMNLGLGVERLAMLLYGYEDIRVLTYPQFYAEWKLTDQELANMLTLKAQPTTDLGEEVKEALIKTAIKNKDAVAPCEFTAIKTRVNNQDLEVRIVEVEKGKRLLGPATLNEIYVLEGNIMGVPPPTAEIKAKEAEKARKQGAKTGIRYIDAVAAAAAHKIEQMIRKKKEKFQMRIPIARSLSDINLHLAEVGKRYITDRKKKIDIRGPIFITIKATLT